LAAEAFSLDMGLLPTGDRFRGRVMCYQAHAYRRLGAFSAAKLAYRISAQQPGEQTAPYANAGLAMLGAETNDAGLIDEAIHYAESFYRDARVHPSVGWMYIAKARFLQCRGEVASDWLARAKAFLPAVYVFEHQWLENWVAIIGQTPNSISRLDTDLTRFRPKPPSSRRLPGTDFDSESLESELFNEGFANIRWATDLDGIWSQREFFVF